MPLSPYDAADILQSGLGLSNVSNNPAIQTAALRSRRISEAKDRMVTDPTNPGVQNLYKMLVGEDASDPYGDAAADTRGRQEADASESAKIFSDPAQAAVRAQKITEAGQNAEAIARGTGMGKAAADFSPNEQSALDAASHRKINESLAPMQYEMGDLGGSGSGSHDNISYIADQVQHDPSMLAKMGLDKGMHVAVMHELANRGADLDTLTNQAKARAQAATVALPKLDELEQQAQDLDKGGWFNPVTGHIRQFLANHGVGGEDFGKFQTNLGLIISNLQNIHAGARGAAAKDLAAKFEKMMSGSTGDLPTFRGQLQAARELLAGYANENAPVRGGVRQTFSGAAPNAGAADPLGLR
jgi:hypothetical protein